MKKISSQTKHTYRKSWLAIAMAVVFCVNANNETLVFASSSDNINLGVTSYINAKCAFKTSTGPSGQTVSFGTYDPVLTNATQASTASGSFDVKCTKNTSAQIAMGTGQYAAYASSGATRAMSDGVSNYLAYEIYSDAAMTTVWNETNTVPFTDNGGSSTNLPIYAEIPAGQQVAAGSYNDTVMMTISY